MKMILASAAVIMIGATSASANSVRLGANCPVGAVVPDNCSLGVFDPTGSVSSISSDPATSTGGSRVQIFDTDDPNTDDPDLEVSQGKVLVVSQDDPANTGSPDDFARGGSITLNFNPGFFVRDLTSFLWVDDETGEWDIDFVFRDTSIADFTIDVSPETGSIEDGDTGFGTFDFAKYYGTGFEAGFEIASFTVDQGTDSGGWAVSVVPVPASVLMLAAGMGLFGAARRMKARGIA